ncbi:MAG: hypothetical protein LKI58_11280 [Actinomyces sp.]|jgi:hypothetical protein|nr:hypothetical protein [Actinomyces sp.]MCI1788621.1 hypothetical protein [Actinomyces sp.]MCI1829723.1 hypothetical protein [Actinomyces sp.]
MSQQVQSARGKLGAAARRGTAADVTTARRDLAAAKIEDYVSRVVAEAPPLTPAQRDRIAALVKAGGAR